MLESISRDAGSDSLRRFEASQLLKMAEIVLANPSCCILELGVHKGVSTRMFLECLGSSAGRLISVDIEDCSSVAKNDNWKFIRSDSSDIDKILAEAPELSAGIDLLYVDSLHTRSHVLAEVQGFFPFVRKGGSIFFDDVDSDPYMSGGRKDNAGTEIGNREIRQLLDEIFRANLRQIDLTFYRGSTGLAEFKKLSSLGSELIAPDRTKARSFKLYWVFRAHVLRLIGFNSR